MREGICWLLDPEEAGPEMMSRFRMDAAWIDGKLIGSPAWRKESLGLFGSVFVFSLSRTSRLSCCKYSTERSSEKV